MPPVIISILNDRPLFPHWGQAEQVKVEHLEYDAAGRLATAQDARGNVKTYGYDAGSRLHTIHYTLPAQTTTKPTPDVTFDYDPAYARLQRVLDGTGTTTYGYVPMNLSDTVYGDGAVGTERKVLPDGTTQIYSFSRAFDALGRVNSGPRQTSAHWDALGRPLDTTSGLGTFGFGFEGQSGRLAQVDAALTGATAVMRTGLAYQGAGTLRRLTGITHQTGADTNSLGALSRHGYGYDGLGRLASWQKWIGAVQASAWTGTAYDGDDQLKEVAESDASGNPSVAFGYSYDNAGNRTAASRVPVAGGDVSRTWSANGLNQLTAQTAGPENGAQFAYDDDGNLLGDGARTYEWDAENRLVAVNYNNNGDRVAWSYDAFHRRVKQTDTTAAAGEVVHDLIWEGLSLIESRASQSGTPGEVRRYYGNGEERLPAGGTPVTRLYYTTDHLGSIRELVDATGAVRARYDYDPYGNRTKQPGGDLDADFGYTGHYTHAASGLVLAPYRGYDPGTGRWLSRDPIGEEGGLNLYGYVFNNPIGLLDPYGEDAVPVGDGSYNFQVNPGSFGKKSLKEVFRLMTDLHVNHPNAGYSGQCATGAQAMTGRYGQDHLWRDAAPDSQKNWFQGPAVSTGLVKPGTMIAAGWPGGNYGGAKGHTGIYMGGNKMLAQNNPTGNPFARETIDPKNFFEVRSRTPYDEDPSLCRTPAPK